MFDQLPLDIVMMIFNNLSYTDIYNLALTNRSLNKIIMSNIKYINCEQLITLRSKEQYDKITEKMPKAQFKIINSNPDPNLLSLPNVSKISIVFKKNVDLRLLNSDILDLTISDCSNIYNFDHIKNVKHLNLFNSDITDDQIQNINLNNIKTLNLSMTKLTKLTGFDMLKNLSCLYLAYTDIYDVSMLGNVRLLDLSFCPNVSDVSALGKVRDLCLYGCYKITDISALINVHKLNISGCINIQNVHLLNNPSMQLIL